MKLFAIISFPDRTEVQQTEIPKVLYTKALRIIKVLNKWKEKYIFFPTNAIFSEKNFNVVLVHLCPIIVWHLLVKSCSLLTKKPCPKRLHQESF